LRGADRAQRGWPLDACAGRSVEDRPGGLGSSLRVTSRVSKWVRLQVRERVSFVTKSEGADRLRDFFQDGSGS
jgi:hypothetical protein